MRLVLFYSQREPWKDGGHWPVLSGITPSKPHRAFRSPTSTVSISLSSALTLSLSISRMLSRFVHSVSSVWSLRSCPHFRSLGRLCWTLAATSPVTPLPVPGRSRPTAHISPCHTLHTLHCVSPLKTKLPACPCPAFHS